MTMPDDVTARQIMDTVQVLLAALVQDEADTVGSSLVPGGFIDVGRQIFGLDAVSVPLGFAAGPHHLSLTTMQAGDHAAVVELQGRDQEENQLTSSSVFLTRTGDGWQVEDIWPVAVGEDLEIERIPEPTGLFYAGDLQLEPLESASLDPVEARLVPGLQEAGIGLHLIERSIHLWRTYSEAAEPDLGDPAAWAAALHLVLLLLEEQEPDPELVVGFYGATESAAVERLSALLALLNASSGEEEEQYMEAPPPIITPSSQILDSTGRPINSGRRDTPGRDHSAAWLRRCASPSAASTRTCRCPPTRRPGRWVLTSTVPRMSRWRPARSRCCRPASLSPRRRGIC